MLPGRAWPIAVLMVAACTTAGDSPFSRVDPVDASAAVDASGADAPAPDATMCTALVAPAVGAPCTDNAECGAVATAACLRAADGWPAVGYCTRTCADDSDCGADARCSPDLDPDPSAETRLCLARCCGAGECGQAGHVCQPSLFGRTFLAENACLPANPAAADGDACATFGDCAPESVCLDNPFNNPGGYCLGFGCEPGTMNGCSPVDTSECVLDPNGGANFCLDRCADGTPCRALEGYVCVDPDGGGAIGSVCVVGAAGVGAACTADPECGPSPWTCVQGASFPGGYCGAALGTCIQGDPDSCPDGSICHSPNGQFAGDQFCADLCDPLDVNSCRTAEGYTCAEIVVGVDACLGP